MFKWISGRQGGGYDKLPLIISERFKFDMYLLRFPVGSEVKPHVDQVESGKHYRLNIVLRKAKIGGRFICFGKTILKLGPICLFRPDINEHMLSKIYEGSSLMFSFGFVRS